MLPNAYHTYLLIHVRVTDFPANSIKKNIENVMIKFKDQLSHHCCLYQYLQPTQEHMTPKFYSLPKIHKPPNEDGIPPIRPIISHTDSRTARFIDHVLQLLAQSYSDYTKNSTQLISTLENLITREDNSSDNGCHQSILPYLNKNAYTMKCVNSLIS